MEDERGIDLGKQAAEDAVPAASRRLTARGSATRSRIIEAAADLVYRHGVAGTSLDDVMEATGTSKSQLYHYFTDKDELVREVIRLQTTRVLAAQAPYIYQLDSIASLRRWAQAVVDATRASSGIGGCPVGSLASELADQSESARQVLAESFQSWESHLTAGLEAMQDRGELSRHKDARDLATSIMAALQGGLLLAQTARTTRPLELSLAMAIDHVARGLSPDHDPHRQGG